MRHNLLKKKLVAGSGVINAWVSLDSAHGAEVLSHAGFDSVTVDLQHGMFGLDGAIAAIRAVSAGPAVPMVRCSRLEASEIGKLLDAGAYGIICPSIDTLSDAEEFVAACRYPPRGRRSFGPARGLLYGGPDYVGGADEEILTWAMIESAQGVANSESIVRTAELDGIYIGPNDLALSLGGAPGGALSQQVLTVIGDLVKIAHENSRFVGVFARDGREASDLLAMGVDLVTPGNDVGLLNSAAAERLTQTRTAAG